MLVKRKRENISAPVSVCVFMKYVLHGWRGAKCFHISSFVCTECYFFYVGDNNQNETTKRKMTLFSETHKRNKSMFIIFGAYSTQTELYILQIW